MRIIFKLFRNDTGEEIASFESPYAALRTYKDLLMPKFQKRYLKGITVTKEGKALKTVRFEKHAGIECATENHTCRIVLEEGEKVKNKLTWDQFVMRMGLPESFFIPLRK